MLDNTTCSDRFILVTADVSSLNMVIKHQDALTTVNWALENSELSRKHKKYIENCLKFGLQHNYVWYNQQYYLQTMGVAMGDGNMGRCNGKFTPSLVNIFMAHWKADVIFYVYKLFY